MMTNRRLFSRILRDITWVNAAALALSLVVLALLPTACSSLWGADNVPVDENLLIVISDPHQGFDIPWSESLENPDYIKKVKESNPVGVLTLLGKRFSNKETHFRHACQEIAAMNPRPAAVICLGDLAFRIGTEEDYEDARQATDLLDEAQIPWYTTMGNHDRLEFFFKTYPEKRLENEPIQNRMVRVIEMPTYDVLLVDSHQNKTEEVDADHPGDGWLNTAQKKWLCERIAYQEAQNRPFTVATHHPSYEIDKSLRTMLLASPCFTAYWYGHEHVRALKQSPDGFTAVVFPALSYAALDEPIGYTLVRTSSADSEDYLTLTLKTTAPNHPDNGKEFQLPLNKER